MNHFLDIGANVGQTFDDFLCQTNEFDGWRIWCFEPSPRHIPALMQRAALCTDRFEIVICPFGLGAISTLRKFWEKDDARGDSFERHLDKTNNIDPGYAILAPIVSIAEFLQEYVKGSDRASIKIDAEGGEYEILRNLVGDNIPPILDRIDSIWVEWHTCDSAEKNARREDTETLFRELGHELKGWMF